MGNCGREGLLPEGVFRDHVAEARGCDPKDHFEMLALLRRMTVNELLGNPDMHLKNMGVIYKDGTTPTLSPAYDIVGYSAFHRRQGHALYLI